jgi:hypothetical protein
MEKARAAEAGLRLLTGMYEAVPACVKISCVQGGALFGSELWWARKKGSRRDNLQLLFNRHAMSALGALLMTPRGALMPDSGLTPAAVALDTRQQRLAAGLASACDGSKSRKQYDHPTPGAPVGRVAATEHAHGRRAEMLRWPAPGEKAGVKTTILDDDTMPKRAAEQWAREKEG